MRRRQPFYLNKRRKNDKKIEEARLTIGKGYLIMLVTGIGQMFDGEKNNRRTGEIYEYL